MSIPRRIRPRERDAIVQSLRAGVVPKVGQQHIQVGRKLELEALVKDIERIADGGSSFRFVIGAYGSGKTFFLHLVRAVAMQKKLVTAHADLSPDRRLHASGGQARSLFAELMRNLATRNKSEGGALPSVVERFVTSAQSEAREQGVKPGQVIEKRLESLSELVGGYDFAHVVGAYWEAHDKGNDQRKRDVVQWLRGEVATKTDARKMLGVRTIVDDARIYDHLKLLGRFVRLAGYSGLFVCLDEMVNLYKLAHSGARKSNYEQILRILNDCLQGSAEGLGFAMGGTPEFLTDTRRGLYSYEALETRLAENTFATDALVDLSGPIVRLPSLSAEDMFVLLRNLRNVFASGDPSQHLVPDDALTSFMAHCRRRIGADYFQTPRNTIKAFVNMLSILEQNPGVEWTSLIQKVEIQPDVGPTLQSLERDEVEDAPAGDDDLSSFRL